MAIWQIDFYLVNKEKYNVTDRAFDKDEVTLWEMNKNELKNLKVLSKYFFKKQRVGHIPLIFTVIMIVLV